MSKHDRWSKLLELLAGEGRLEVDDAATALGVSPATIRRDLDELAEQQMLVRTRGGAIAHGVSYELPLRYKSSARPREAAHATAVAGMIAADGDVVGLNGGTTTTEVARALASGRAAAVRDVGAATRPRRRGPCSRSSPTPSTSPVNSRYARR
ncbi:hypothetical protein SALBM217S_06127 [Streptomyces griseoloalbus]